LETLLTGIIGNRSLAVLLRLTTVVAVALVNAGMLPFEAALGLILGPILELLLLLK